MKKFCFYSTVVTVFISLLFSSCEYQKKDPLFAGSWKFSENIVAGDLVYNTTRYLTLTKDTYEEIFIVQRERSGLIAGILGTKGKLAFSRYYMVFMLEELGTCVRDQSDACTEAVQWFGEGTLYWTENSPYFESTVKGEFEAGESTLYLKRDLNNDNDTDDTGEDIKFERI